MYLYVVISRIRNFELFRSLTAGLLFARWHTSGRWSENIIKNKQKTFLWTQGFTNLGVLFVLVNDKKYHCITVR